MFDGFFTALEQCPEKPAFVYLQKGRLCEKSYGSFFTDVKKAVTMLKHSGVSPGDSVLLLMKPSYRFYVFLLAGYYLQYKTVIIDDFSDFKRLEEKIILSGVSRVICTKGTRLLRRFVPPLKGLACVSAESAESFEPSPSPPDLRAEAPALVTFTSGSTGRPKAVVRTLGELETQMRVLTENFGGGGFPDAALVMLPVYPLAGLEAGVTNVLFFKKTSSARGRREFCGLVRRTGAKTVIGSVNKYLPLKNAPDCIKRVYTGGSIIFPRDARRLRDIFPRAAVTYIYGSSEAVVISKTTLTDYLTSIDAEKFDLGEPVSGIAVKTCGDGEILISGDFVVHNYLRGGDNARVRQENGRIWLCTGDIGYMKDGRLYIRGRKHLSDLSADPPVFNYEREAEAMNRFPLKRRACFLVLDGKRFLVTEREKAQVVSSLKKAYTDCAVINVKKIPLDERHRYKADYVKLKELIYASKRK